MEEDYCLEIYQPGSTHDVLVSFNSDGPFGAISRGDTLHPGSFPYGAEAVLPDALDICAFLIWLMGYSHHTPSASM